MLSVISREETPSHRRKFIHPRGPLNREIPQLTAQLSQLAPEVQPLSVLVRIRTHASRRVSPTCDVTELEVLPRAIVNLGALVKLACSVCH